MKRRKYSFTLMEIMIGFSLLSIVLGMVFSTLYQETILSRRVNRMEQETMSKLDLQQRLDKIFANTLPVNPTSNERSVYSAKNPKSLFVFFDNGIDPDPTFSGIVKSAIKLDQSKLLLIIYGDKEDKHARTMVLREHVKSLDFEFMLQTPKGLFTTEIWDKKTNFSPIFVKMTLNRDEEYVFWVNRECEAIALKEKQ